MKTTSILSLGLAAAAGCMAPGAARAQAGFLPKNTGQEIFQNICSTCHLKGGKGDPATYPALAGNPKLASAGYVSLVVLNGQKAMPAFASMLTDQQVANVVAYVRTNLGNNFKGAWTAADVKPLRKAPEVEE